MEIYGRLTSYRTTFPCVSLFIFNLPSVIVVYDQVPIPHRVESKINNALGTVACTTSESAPKNLFALLIKHLMSGLTRNSLKIN